jgi:predicted nucleotidyltransferase
MPVRSLTSSVLVWPNREEVLAALARWARDEAERHPELVRLGCFGSYARGDWGPGSDLDLVAVVRESEKAFELRAVFWTTERLPVPAQLLVYTEEEWDALLDRGGRFGGVLAAETRWVYPGQQT